MFTTAAMIKLGKVYQNLMVDLQATSQKLKERGKRIIMLITGIDYEQAEKYLKEADYQVKTALVMILGKVDKNKAKRNLKAADGLIKGALGLLSKGSL
jgi:N-acetylmuramic acid 6-phosphate etherase